MAVVPLRPTNNLPARIESWFPGADLSQYAEQLDLFYTVAEILQSRIQTPTSPQLDIYVRLPALCKWQDVSHNHSANFVLLLLFPLSYAPNPFHPNYYVSILIILVW
jgi:hypothetical protein